MNIYGINPVIEALKGSPEKILRIVIDKEKSGKRISEIISLARARKIPYTFEMSAALVRKSGGENHQGVLAEMAAYQYSDLGKVLDGDPSRIILLDGVEDPHNLGAVIRTAEASGADAVIIPSRNTCGVTATVIKSSAGAAAHLPVCRVTNTVRTMELLKKKGFWTVGLDMRGEEHLPDDLKSSRLLLVGGGEHRGLRPLVREHCDFLCRLPMKGQVNSLNLSVAVGILVYSLVDSPDS